MYIVLEAGATWNCLDKRTLGRILRDPQPIIYTDLSNLSKGNKLSGFILGTAVMSNSHCLAFFCQKKLHTFTRSLVIKDDYWIQKPKFVALTGHGGFWCCQFSKTLH